MSHRVVVIPGDGIGPDVVAAAQRAVEATGAAVEWDVHQVDALPLGDALLTAAAEAEAVLKGPVSASGGRSPNLALREALGLVLGVRPARGHGRDLVVARMLAGDLYAGIEVAAGTPEAERLRALSAAIPDDAAIALKPISRSAVAAATRAALAWARDQGRRRVTVVHKATVMPQTDGLFLSTARAVALDYPDVELDDRLVDAVCHDLATGRGELDVIFGPMLYGDLLSDLCAGLTGGIGLAPGVNIGPACAVFEAVHGTAPRHAGRGSASPLAMIRCGAMLLAHLGEAKTAARLHEAADATANAVMAGRLVANTAAQRDAVLAGL